nr:hypothetical protein [Tanacetum cinerariifolium]
MVTRSQSGIVKPIDRLSLHTTSISPLPKSPFLALQNPYWNNAIHDEYNAQQLGTDCDETFSPVVKPATIHIVLSLAVSRRWPILQLDVKNAFLNGDLSETVPPGFLDPRYPHHVMPLVLDFTTAVVTLPYSFFVRDLRGLNYFLGISATRHSTGLFLSQKHYTIELLACAYMTNCNPSRTPVYTDSKLGPEGVPVHDPTLYRSLAGGLQYLTFTGRDISYAATFKELWDLLLPSFLLGTHMRIGQAAPQQGGLLQVTIFFWETTSCLGLLSTSRLSFIPADEYRGVANFVAKTAWLHNLLRELHSSLSAATLVCCDNVSTTYLSANPVQHQRTKHIEIDIHFVCDLVTASQI